MGNYSRYSKPRLQSFELFWEDPVFIPEVVPHCEEPRTYELSDVWCDANDLKPIDDEVIKHKVYQSNKHITPCDLGLVFL